MDFKDFTAGENDNGRRIDKVIRIFASDLNLSEIYKYIRKGLIKVNHKKVKSDYKVCTDDVISIASFIYDRNQQEIKNNDKTLQNDVLPEIVFQNEHILILNKPYDVLVHGSQNSLDKIVLNYYKNNIKDNSLSFSPGPLHRIDKKTTGLIAFSMSIEGARWFSENIQTHIIQKKYFTLLEGLLTEDEVWEDEIKRNENSDNSVFHTVDINKNLSDDSDFKQALSIIKPIQSGKYQGKDVTFAEVEIKTGRTHQIRAQCSIHGHPILGDTAYGGMKLINSKQDFYLQAAKLVFPADNPLNLPVNISIPPSENFLSLLKYCDIKKTGL